MKITFLVQLRTPSKTHIFRALKSPLKSSLVKVIVIDKRRLSVKENFWSANSSFQNEINDEKLQELLGHLLRSIVIFLN